MTLLYLICFILGLVLSLLAVFGGLGRLHLGHLHLGHLHLGHLHLGHLRLHPGTHAPVRLPTGPGAKLHSGTQAPVVNGFTLPAFLCWFGGAGYLLRTYSSLLTPFVLLLACVAGLVGAAFFYVLLFRLLLPREQVLRAEDTRMEGVIARVTDEVRGGMAVGEILFSQAGARRAAAARSADGLEIPRGTEVVVLRYERGIAYVRSLMD